MQCRPSASMGDPGYIFNAVMAPSVIQCTAILGLAKLSMAVSCPATQALPSGPRRIEDMVCPTQLASQRTLPRQHSDPLSDKPFRSLLTALSGQTPTQLPLGFGAASMCSGTLEGIILRRQDLTSKHVNNCVSRRRILLSGRPRLKHWKRGVSSHCYIWSPRFFSTCSVCPALSYEAHCNDDVAFSFCQRKAAPIAWRVIRSFLLLTPAMLASFSL